MITKEFLQKKLTLFVKGPEAESMLNAAIASAKTGQKENYSKEEMTKILDGLIEQGGFAEFVARNAKISLSF